MGVFYDVECSMCHTQDQIDEFTYKNIIMDEKPFICDKCKELMEKCIGEHLEDAIAHI